MKGGSAMLVAAFTIGCGGGQTRLDSVFSSDWRDDGGVAVRRLHAKLASFPVRRNAPVAVGVVENAPGGGLPAPSHMLVGAPLAEGGAYWSYSHPIDGRPQIAGSVVVAAGGGELFALDALTGRPLWVRQSGGALRGAGDDGRTTVVSLGGIGDTGSIVLAIAHDGSVLRQLETPHLVGVPAVLGNYAFLPWQGQYVTAYDISSGEENARLSFGEPVSRAFTHGGRLYFGERGLFRFDEKVSQASTRQASRIALPAHELPGEPKWFRPGTERRGATADALDKVALFAAPDGAGSALDSDHFVATYYKIAVGLDAKTGTVAWVRKHASDFMAGSAFQGGVALCDSAGKVTLASTSTGATLSSISLGNNLKSCTVEADGLVSGTFGGRPAGEDAAPKSLAEQIAAVIGFTENEMLPIQKLLLGTLGKLEDPKATKMLIDLAIHPRTPALLVADAERALSGRRNGAEYVIEALGRHYDFLKDVLRAPPLGALADAALGMKESRAAPALASHLLDPADAASDVRHAAAALTEIARKSELPQLRTFFALYRTTAADEDLAAAVVSVARTLVKLGGPEDKALVLKAAEDPLTLPPIKWQLAQLNVRPR